jgi:hypothetical protein
MSLIIKKNTTFKIPRTGSGVPILWKIAIFGAGDGYSSSEYIWDGSAMSAGEKVYLNLDGNILSFDEIWYIDIAGIGTTYTSNDLITWSIGQSLLPPAPLSALSFSQSSYIQTIVLAGGNPDQSGTYSWDGTTFVNGKPKYFGPLKPGASENNYIFWNTENYMLYGWKIEEMLGLSVSPDLASNWSPSDAIAEPTVSSIIYTS